MNAIVDGSDFGYRLAEHAKRREIGLERLCYTLSMLPVRHSVIFGRVSHSTQLSKWDGVFCFFLAFYSSIGLEHASVGRYWCDKQMVLKAQCPTLYEIVPYGGTSRCLFIRSVLLKVEHSFSALIQ